MNIGELDHQSKQETGTQMAGSPTGPPMSGQMLIAQVGAGQ